MVTYYYLRMIVGISLAGMLMSGFGFLLVLSSGGCIIRNEESAFRDS